MARKRYTPETIIRRLREAEVLQGQGKTVAETVKQFGVTILSDDSHSDPNTRPERQN